MKKYETKMLFGREIAVTKYYMLPTPKPGEPYQWIYEAWQKTDAPFDGRHRSISTFEGVWYGKIGTDPEPEKYDHLPAGSDERIKAVNEAYEYRAMIASQYIHEAFPETRGHLAEQFGEICITK